MKKYFLLTFFTLLLFVINGNAQRIIDPYAIRPWITETANGVNDGSLLTEKSSFSESVVADTLKKEIKRIIFTENPLIKTTGIINGANNRILLTGENNVSQSVAVDSPTGEINRIISPESSVIDDGTRVLGVGMTVEFGHLSFRPAQDFVITKTPPVNSNLFRATNTAYVNGKYYFSVGVFAGGTISSHIFYIIDAETGAVEQQVNLPDGYYYYAAMMAYNPVDQKIYALAYDGLRRLYLSTLNEDLNPTNGFYTRMYPMYESLAAMAFDAEGTLYGITSRGDLVTIDLQTGETAIIGHTGVEHVYSSNGMVVDNYNEKIYWTALTTGDTDGAAVYEVDPQTGASILLKQLSPYTQILGLRVVSPEAAPKAPAVVESLRVTFPSADSHNGTISLTAPSKAFDGSVLNGNLNMKVYINDGLVQEMQLAAGALTDFPYTFTRGEHKISVVASNAAGEGVKGSISIYVGMDTPVPVGNLNLEVAENGTSSLTWETPTGGINGGYIDAEQIAYKITRMPGNVDCGTVTQTSFSEQLPDNLERYYYTVTASIDDLVGSAVQSNSIVYGDGIVPPLTARPNEENFSNLCTIINNDDNGYEWEGNYVNAGHGDADDWLITPPLQLDNGVYRLKIRYAGLMGKVNMKFTIGRSQTIEGQNSIIKERKDIIPSEGSLYLDEYITIEESGKYYIGVNLYVKYEEGEVTTFSSGGMFDFSIELGPGMFVPAQSTELKAEPFAEGELKTTISFVTPTKTFAGSELESLSKAEIYNGDRLVSTVNRAQAGTRYTVTDENASQGINEYTVIAYNEHGAGGESSVDVYVGEDFPGLVSGMNVTYESNYKVNVSWGAPSTTGVNGGYVDPEFTRYKLARAEGIYGYVNVSGAQNLKETSYIFDESENLAAYQDIITYGVTPFNSLGEGGRGSIGVVLGKPYDMFYNESFPTASVSTSYWSIVTLSGSASWYLNDGSSIGFTPQDNDGGFAAFYHSDNNETAAGIISPIISLEGTQNPALSFWMHHNQAATDGSLLSIQVAGENGKYTTLKTINLAGDNGWKEYNVSLKEFAGQERVFIAFVGLIYDQTSIIGIDNIAVYENLQSDMAAVSLQVHDNLIISERVQFTGTIRNMGLSKASGYTVELYANNKLISVKEGMDLFQKDFFEITFDVTPDVFHADQEITYTMKVVFAGDVNADNDSIEIKRYVSNNDLPAPTNLTGTPQGNQVSLSWKEPDAPVQTTVTDNFESYTAWLTDGINPWTLIDGDKQIVTSINGVTIPYYGNPKAYQVWNPSELTVNIGNSWNPNSGKQCLISWSAAGFYSDFSPVLPKNDDWIISPRIAGGSTLVFYASEASDSYGHETFEVRVSYSTPEPEMFDLLSSVTLPGIGWKRYEYSLPSEARYFAIRCVSEETFAFLLDDITYTTGRTGMELLGYNIYRNGEKLNDEPVESITFIDDFQGNAVYRVSAVYDEGESGLSNEVRIGHTGIEGATNDHIRIIGGDGFIRIHGAAGKNISIYDVAGLLIKKENATANIETVPLNMQGVYIVRVGSVTGKVVVK